MQQIPVASQPSQCNVWALRAKPLANQFERVGEMTIQQLGTFSCTYSNLGTCCATLHRFHVYPIVWVPMCSSIFVTSTRLCTCALIPRPTLISVCARHGLKEFFAPNGRERPWSWPCMQVLKALARVPRKYEQCIAMLNWQLSRQAHHEIRISCLVRPVDEICHWKSKLKKKLKRTESRQAHEDVQQVLVDIPYGCCSSCRKRGSLGQMLRISCSKGGYTWAKGWQHVGWKKN